MSVTIDLQVVRNYHLSPWDIDVFTSVIRQCIEDGRSEERTLAAIGWGLSSSTPRRFALRKSLQVALYVDDSVALIPANIGCEQPSRMCAN